MARSKINGCGKGLKKPQPHGRWFCLFSAISFLTVTTTAQLQGQSQIPSDRGVKNSPIAAPFSWTGFYVGGELGWNWAKYDLGNSSDRILVLTLPTFQLLPVTVALPGFSFDDSQLLGGGQLGYNQQFGIFVIGFEGDFEATKFSGSNEAQVQFLVPGPEVDFLGFQRSLQTNWMASTRLRAGVVWERFLFYGTGGAAFADVSVHGFDQFLGIGPTRFQSSSDDATVIGWTAGLGAEYAVVKAFSLGLEYRHSDFGSKSFNLTTPGSGLSAHSTNVNFTDDQVTGRDRHQEHQFPVAFPKLV
jgi:outer membrane immunogenic protein